MKRMKVDSGKCIQKEQIDPDVLCDIIKDSLSDNLLSFQEELLLLLKEKDDKIQKMEKEHQEIIKNIIDDHQEKYSQLEAENLQLKRKRNPRCKECDAKSKKVSDLEQKLEESKRHQASEDVRMKTHIFKRQEKLKRYRALLTEKDEEIEKFQEEIFALEEKLKEIPVDDATVDGLLSPEKPEEDPVDELLSPMKPEENPSYSSTNPLFLLVENTTKFYKSALDDSDKQSDPDSVEEKIEGIKSRGVNVKRRKS